MLAAEKVGKGSPVVALHGFTQTRRSWLPIVPRLATAHQLTLVDAPGHGGSDHVRADLWDTADLLADVGGGGAYLGYSMGARMCLHLALAHPDLVTRLILVGAHPGIADPVERRRRRDHDEELARRLEAAGVPAFVDWWLSQPMFATLDPALAGRDDRLTNTAAGLASSLRLAATGTQDPLWDRLGELPMPVLLVAGALDAKFAELGRAMASAIGANARLELILGAGHACHLERPATFGPLAAEFLDA